MNHLAPVELSAIVVTHHARALLGRALRALDEATARSGAATEIIVVDNASTDGSSELVRSDHPWVRLERHARNTGFAGGVQHGLGVARGELVLLVNDDAELDPEALGRLLAVARAAPDAGAVTAQVRFHARPDVINTA